MSDDAYVIPGTRTLRNKLGITDRSELDRKERTRVANRTLSGVPKGDFDLPHLQNIHRHLFQDVYDWAGELRHVDITKDTSVFMPASHVENGIAFVHKELTKAKFLTGLSPDDFATRAAEVIGNVNYAHPFREGNGRAQMQYLKLLGKRAGHRIDPRRLEQKSWIKASIAANDTNFEPMGAAIRHLMITNGRAKAPSEHLFESSRPTPKDQDQGRSR